MDDLKDKIENLPKLYHIEIGKLLNNHNITLNENQNGIFVNLSTLSPDIIDKLMNMYIILSYKKRC